MKCEKCGFENEADARFCAECGSTLDDKQQGGGTQNEADAADSAVAKEGAAGEGGTKDDSKPASAAPHLPIDEFKDKFLALDKKVKAAIAAGVVIVIAAVAAFAFMGNGPSESQVESDITSGDFAKSSEYGVGDDYTINSVKIVKSEKNDFGSQIVESRTLTVSFEASNSDADVSGTGEMIYVKNDGKWSHFLGSPDKTYKAKSGISEDRILENAGTILQKASYNLRKTYGSEDAKVKSVDFDKSAQTCTAELTFKKSTTFSDSKVKVKAKFNFENGVWKLDNATLDGKNEVSYDKLIGTWTGTFKSTDALYDGKCYGAEDSTPTLIINSIDKDSLKVEGTFTGLAHYHDKLDSDSQNTSGDTTTDTMNFVATLEENGSIFSVIGESFDVDAEVEFPETSDGAVNITFGFGSSKDPNSAGLEVGTKRGHGFSFANNFTDYYTLTKAK